jgi:hypothetical protein
MNGDRATVADAAMKAGEQGRQRSTISFPYMDLASAIELAKAIHDHVGNGDCDDDQLAAWTDQSAKSSTFRVQVYAARTFGVLEGDGAKHKLTDLGRMIVDPNREREARARSFLTVPLYRAVHDQYRGGVLPPPAALERDMVTLGVSEKQKNRARQVFERSAEQAGFFEHGRNRLVMPGIAGSRDATQPEEAPREKDNAGNGTGGGGGKDPLIAALIQKLPSTGEWPVDERVTWLKMLAMAFQITYGQQPEISIKKEAAN